MSKLANRIDEVLENRHGNLPRVVELTAQWAEARALMTRLAENVTASSSDAVDPALLDAAAVLGAPSTMADLDRVDALLRAAQERFARQTINLGVSGVAKVGKSTLLQSISGLGENALPTSKGVPVTAVRSRIVNSSGDPGALVTFHTWESFRNDVLLPLHEATGLVSPPATQKSWPSLDYSSVPDDDSLSGMRANLDRLRQLQLGAATVQRLLGSAPQTVPLDRLRPYVAYPSQAGDVSPDDAYAYAAVNDVSITCHFPHEDVDHLGLIDLPGLGEIDPKADSHHVDSLQHQVDLVLIVKRPTDTTSFWNEADRKAFDLVQGARGPIAETRDFCVIFLNSGNADPELARQLGDDVAARAPGVTVLEGDASSADSVRTDVLDPVMRHLAERLPVMDAQVLEAAIAESEACARRVRRLAQEVGAALATPPLSGSGEEHLREMALESYRTLADELYDVVKDLSDAISADDQLNAFITEVEACYEGAERWIDEEAFEADSVEQLRRRMRVQGSSGIGVDELNRIRIEISDRFAKIDHHFALEVDRVAQRVRDVFKDAYGDLVPCSDSSIDDLRSLADLVESGDERCPNLAAALRELADVSFSYRTHLYPDVREVVRALLEWQFKDPETGELKTLVVVDPTDEGARIMIETLRRQAHRVAHQSKNRLILEADTPARLIHAVTEHFVDRAIRSDQSDREMQRLARSYKDIIWPGEFDKYVSTQRSSARVRKDQQELMKQLILIEGVGK